MLSRARRFGLCCVAIVVLVCSTGEPTSEGAGAGPGETSAREALPEGLSTEAWDRIRVQLRAAAFEVQREAGTEEDVVWRAGNPPHGFSISFSKPGIRIRPRDGALWSWGLEVVGYGRDATNLPPPSAPVVVVAGNRVEYRREGLTEWYVNDERGLEQGFTLSARPVGEGSLRVALSSSGSLSASVSEDARSIALHDAEGQTVLRYGGLEVYDATGRFFPSRLELAPESEGSRRRLTLLFEDDGAVYPVTVDPLITAGTAKVKAADAGANDWLGASVGLDGDTLVVGALGDDDAGGQSGAAYVFTRNMGGAAAWGQVAKLTASDAAAGDQFGRSVAISGDTVVVGAFLDDDAGGDSGSAYVFARNEGGADAWGEVRKLTAGDAAAGDQFGFSVTISSDTVIVGAFADDDGGADSGAAYVFERNTGGAEFWGQVAKLTASDAAAGDWFGYAVAVSGDTVVSGAARDDGAGMNSGSAYVFARNAGGADVWGQVAKLVASDAAAGDEFGISVAISGDTVVAGAHRDDGVSVDSGAAYVFERNMGGADVWGQVAKLTASDAGAGDTLGASVAVSVDTILVGAPLDNEDGADSGAAYLFERNASGPNAWGRAGKVTASDAAAGDQFGFSVAISGNRLVLGSLFDDDGGADSGSAYVALRTGLGWAPMRETTAADGVAGDWFGYAVAIDQDRALVGMPRDGDGGALSGSAYLFERNVGGSDNWGPLAKLTASDAAPGDHFGWSVAMSGDTVIVGAPVDDDGGADSGSAYVFERNMGGVDTWGEVAKLTASDAAAGDQFGFSVALSGDTAVTGAFLDDDSGADSGSAYVFSRNTGGVDVWGEVTKLTASDGAAGDQFGWAVAMHDGTVLIGAHQNGVGGSAYVFERNQGGVDAFGQVTQLTAADAAAGDALGSAVALHGDTAVVGAPNDDDAGADSGSAYVFARNVGGADVWGQVAKVTAADAASGDQFGSSVAIHVDLVLVGTPFSDGTGDDSGSAYLFTRNLGGANMWGQGGKITARDAAGGDRFGWSTALSARHVVTGAYLHDDSGVDSGAVYLHQLTSASADLAVSKDDGQAVAVPGAAVSYAITVTNNGPTTVTSLRVTDLVPAALLGPVFTPSTGSYNGATGVWTGLALATSNSATLTLDATVDSTATGSLVNTVEVTPPAGVLDLSPGNNTATDTDTLTPQADLAVTKNDGLTAATPGITPVTYTIIVSNAAGPSAVVGATVADVFPADLTCNWTCAPSGGASCTAGPVAGDINDSVGLPVAGMVTYTATCSIDVLATGTLSNTATVTAPVGVTDPTPGNNSATDGDTVLTDGDLFFTVDPCRILDTRNPAGPLGGPAMVAGAVRIFTIANTCGIPLTAKAVSVNLAVTQPTHAGNLRLYPAGTPVPLVAAINYVAGQTRSNNAVTPLNPSGEMAVFVGQASGTVHFVLDVNGFFQ